MKTFIIFKLFIFICVFLYPQNNAVLVPRNVYVGDHATLMISLPPSSSNLTDIILMPNSADFPYDTNIDFHRIVLERRITGSRLIIEFTAFVTGLLHFPVIAIGDENFSGITVTINSVINSTASGLELFQPASSLAMPGTAIMLYGIITAFIFLFLLTIWFILKGRYLVEKLYAKWHRWKYFRFIDNTDKNLQKLLLKGENKRKILDILSVQFRIFLSFITGENCRAMTAGEFEGVSGNDAESLGSFFRRCDELRFSGREIGKDDIVCLLDDMRIFVENIRRPEQINKSNNIEEAA